MCGSGQFFCVHCAWLLGHVTCDKYADSGSQSVNVELGDQFNGKYKGDAKLFRTWKLNFRVRMVPKIIADIILCPLWLCVPVCGQNSVRKMSKNVYNTMYSQAVTHPSTNMAQCCLTSVIGRELVFSTWYGRRQIFTLTNCLDKKTNLVCLVVLLMQFITEGM